MKNIKKTCQRREKYNNDEEYRNKIVSKGKEKYKTNEEHREKQKLYRKEHQKYKKDNYEAEKKIIKCVFCNCDVLSVKLYGIYTHYKSKKHIRNVEKMMNELNK